MKRYYLILSRLSLAVIILQALIFLYSGLNVEKFNRRIDQMISDLSRQTASSPAGGPFTGKLGRNWAGCSNTTANTNGS